MRRVSAFACTVVGARTLMQMSGSSPVLANNAKAQGFKSPIWVDMKDDAWWMTPKAKDGKDAKDIKELLVEDFTKTVVPVPAMIELYNVDQLASTKGLTEAELKAQQGHFSLKTGKRYSGNFQATLAAFAKEHKLDSNCWLTSYEIKKRGLNLARGAMPCRQSIMKNADMVNADQFRRAEAVGMRAYSGATGRAYAERISETLSAHATKNGFDSAVYFTQAQLEKIEIALPVGTMGVEVDLGAEPAMRLYAVEDVKNYLEWVKELQRFSVDVPSYLMSGQPVPDTMMDAAKNLGGMGYFVSELELKNRGKELVPDAKKYVEMPKAETSGSSKFVSYNLRQLSAEDQAKAMKEIGKVLTYVPEKKAV